jgi:hypothetical protein
MQEQIPLATSVQPAPGRAKVAWSQLEGLLAKRNVIPVIGSDVVVVDGELGKRPLTDYIAKDVAETLELDQGWNETTTLNDVACRALASNMPIDDVYTAVKDSLESHPFEPPESLRKLARINAFTLFVTTTFDDLLKRAIDIERFGGEDKTAVYAYSPEQVEDIPDAVDRLRPSVYHLLGRASKVRPYVVTEEDTLEFVHALQSDMRSPKLLLDGLGSHSLLIIGSGYSDWLARFFLRVTKRERLLLARRKTDFVADARMRDETGLKSFLKQFNAGTKVFEIDAPEFIDELVERWEKIAGAAHAPAPQTRGSNNEEHNIFISYAHEDSPDAKALASALRNLGVPVWLDKPVGYDEPGGLIGGDKFPDKIAAQIRAAALFVPLLSRNVETVDKRFFRREWGIALDTAVEASDAAAYISPVRLDDVSQTSPHIPPGFKQGLHWEDIGASGVERVALNLRDAYRNYQRARSEGR